MEQNLLTGIFITLAIVVLILSVLFFAAEWRIFNKAGEKGWKALIPVYDIFVSHHIAGMSHVWFIIEVIIWIMEIMFEIVKFPEPLVLWFGVATGVFTLVSEITHIIKMCCCFGKGTGFKIGSLLLTPVFFLILAFGKSEYHKPAH